MSRKLPLRRLVVVVLGLTLILATEAARAGDDEDEQQPEQTVEQGIVKNLIKGLGGQSMDDSSINYRERSPLVVPSKTDLPPPVSRKIQPGPNWPKDPDAQARREAIAASKEGPVDPMQAARPLMPSELAAKPIKKRTTQTTEDVTPGAPMNANPMLSPSDLGFKNSMFSNVFGGSNKEDSVPFKAEPTRDSLTMPPAGYQTPSPNFKYGAGPIKSVTPTQYNPVTDKGGDPK
ncbi:MAG: hypothetical protein K2X60_08590 [Xanthobacteraceae bacterium]|nr:hypothetical protein [Xanthobacteraceae bacterium]